MPNIGDSDYNEEFDLEQQFSIEISIPMRKPVNHFSRAPGVVLDILKTNNGGTFFEGQGYWEGIQEPVIYLMISNFGSPREIIGNVKNNLVNIQRKLKQQEVFLKLNGRTFVGRVISEDEISKFPKQWEFDDDMRAITANRTRKDEHFKIIYARAAQDKREFQEALDLFREVLSELIIKKPLPKGSYERLDALICSTNVIGISTRKDMIGTISQDEISTHIMMMNERLPFCRKSEFESDILSLHAEARIRGNRLQLYTRSIDFKTNKDDLISDGVFALKLLEEHLNVGGYPYLEQDPIEDILMIKKYVDLIAGFEHPGAKEVITSISKANEFYSRELRK